MDTPVSASGLVYSFWPRALAPRSNEEELVRQIVEVIASYGSLSDRALRDRVDPLRRRCQAGTPGDIETLIASFALLGEAVRRTLGFRLYDVQFLAGLALCRGTIAEMRTGEGKTFSAALPAFTHALSGRGVHLMTVNAYLARRDHELLRPAFDLLGLSSAVLPTGDVPAVEKRAAYACDITYGPGYEFGFDYLRDQVSLLQLPKRRLGETHRRLFRGQLETPAELLQRGHHFAIVDEADSVMLDEATIPLILSGCASATAPNPELYLAAARMADQLEVDRDYLLDSRTQALLFTEQGAATVSESCGQILPKGLMRPWNDYVQQALRAKLVVRKDVNYVVDQEAVRLVDENTGRIFSDRSWRNGLRQAVEAIEGIPITPETQPLARISRQRYLRLYDHLCGTTGTATGSEREFWQVYNLPVVAIPLRIPSRRSTLPTRFFAKEQFKWNVILEEIRRVHQTGKPILVGTRTIQDSELIARELQAKNLAYRLLNGKQDEDEAKIIASAGEPGAVTVATNMAGRGTDIKLANGVSELGGLHVIGSEPHESARVDRQLAGRAARQGDPGSCRFFASAEDRLIVANSPRLTRRMKRIAQKNGEIATDLSSEITSLQKHVQQRDFARRRQLFARDHWVEEVLSKLADAT